MRANAAKANKARTAVLVLSTLGIALALWLWSSGHRMSRATSSPIDAASIASRGERADEPGGRGSIPGAVRESLQDPASKPAAASDAPTRIAFSGRLTLDGVAPSEAFVRFRAGDGTQEGSRRLDGEGRFTLELAPTPALTLEFDVPLAGGRAPVLPRWTGPVEPGAAPLELAWRLAHINVRVHGDPGDWNQAEVQVLGSGCEARFESDEKGKSKLSLVAPGHYRFEARHRSGLVGEAELDLTEDSDLETVVIQLASPR
jgi:hypothetical protein